MKGESDRLRSIVNDINIIIQALIEKGLITEEELNEKRKVYFERELEQLKGDLYV